MVCTGRDFADPARPAEKNFRPGPGLAAANPPRSDPARPAKQHFRLGPGPARQKIFPKTTGSTRPAEKISQPARVHTTANDSKRAMRINP